MLLGKAIWKIGRLLWIIALPIRFIPKFKLLSPKRSIMPRIGHLTKRTLLGTFPTIGSERRIKYDKKSKVLQIGYNAGFSHLHSYQKISTVSQKRSFCTILLRAVQKSQNLLVSRLSLGGRTKQEIRFLGQLEPMPYAAMPTAIQCDLFKFLLNLK